MLEKDLILPKIRSDIQLNEAPPEPEGAPSWTLYDPAANKYFKIGWLEFECLTRFEKHTYVSDLTKTINKETTLEADEEDITAIVEFLITHKLVYSTTNESTEYFDQELAAMKQPWWQRMIHSYLFFILPLFKSEQFLKKTYPLLSPLFTRPFMIGVLVLLAYGIFLSIQRFDEIANTFVNYLTLEGVILFVGATIIVKIIHELGHAYTATKYGVPVTTIGVAFIVLYPILYTETTNAWKLKNRKERLTIAASGMMAELALSAIALILWHILPPGMAQSLCFMVAIVSMLASLIVNLNPLMKFDGYYLFSDIVGIDNLQDRSFAFAKYRLRKILWGWDSGRPEITDYKKQRLLTIFGFSVWVYRFFLYLGIAILVYNLFFQPLGLIFMIVELAFFIGLPIIRELKIWIKNFGDIMSPLRGKIALVFYIFLLSIIFWPLQKSIEVPVTLHAKNYARYYPSIPAKIEQIKVTQGQDVNKGDILFHLSSYNLNHNISITTQKLNDLKDIRASSQATQELANQRSLIDNEIENVQKELEGLQTILAKLTIRAKSDGTVKIIDPAIREGQWVNTRYMLALIADENNKTLSGYISEKYIDRLSNINTGKFYAEYSPFDTFDVQLNSVEKSVAETLFWSELSSIQGGPIPAEKNSDGTIKPLPRFTVYPIRFDLTSDQNKDLLPKFVGRGTVILSGKRESFANILIKKGVSLFIMDSGF